jgi:hypothetical protein
VPSDCPLSECVYVFTPWHWTKVEITRSSTSGAALAGSDTSAAVSTRWTVGECTRDVGVRAGADVDGAVERSSSTIAGPAASCGPRDRVWSWVRGLGGWSVRYQSPQVAQQAWPHRAIQRAERGLVAAGGFARRVPEVKVPVHGHTLPSSRPTGHDGTARVPHRRLLLGATSTKSSPRLPESPDDADEDP